MADPLDPGHAALAAAMEILVASGHAETADLLRAAELEPAGAAERWEVGSRTVEARPFALIVDPSELVALRDSATLEHVKDAIAAVMRSPTTELASLLLVVRLPQIQRTWGHVYRSLSPAAVTPPPSDEAILAGALALALALEEPAAVDALGSATLGSIEVPTSGERALRRFVLHVPPTVLALAEKKRAFGDRLRWLIHQAGTRASSAVAEVEICLLLPS